MNSGHVPIRTCRGCGRRAPKDALARMVFVDGSLLDDPGGRLGGRGIYCCRDEQCLLRLKNKKKIRGKRVDSARAR